MRRLAAALLATAAVLAVPAAAGADELKIRMPGKFFDPARATIVAGDVVRFENDDFVTHDVRIGGLFDSGPIGRAGSWQETMRQPGEFPFICTLHAFMSGNLSVLAATLEAAPDDVLEGEPLRLTGRVAAGTAQILVERSTRGGAWTPVGAPVAPAADGTYEAVTKAVEGASYRVTAPAGASRSVAPRIAAAVELHLGLHRGKRHTRLQVHAMPAPKGMVATLELYARWRYRWRERRSVRLDAHGRATFRLPASLRTYARVSLRRRASGGAARPLHRHARGPALVRSHVLRTSDGRTAPDPDTIGPPLPHGGGGGEHAPAGGHGGHEG